MGCISRNHALSNFSRLHYDVCAARTFTARSRLGRDSKAPAYSGQNFYESECGGRWIAKPEKA
jgi:hypothetical protein